MNPEALDIYVARGATFALEVEYEDTDGNLMPFPEGWSGKAQVRPMPLDTLMLEFAVVLVDPGVIVISATDEATAAMPSAPARAVWDLLLFDPDGNKWPVLAGTANIRTVVTE